MQGAPEAEAFNDQAVNENLSISEGLKIMKNDKNLNFLSNWKNCAKAEFRRFVIEVVLATDMARCATPRYCLLAGCILYNSLACDV